MAENADTNQVARVLWILTCTSVIWIPGLIGFVIAVTR